jgi:transcriptional regulator with XRE-family HTH domain
MEFGPRLRRERERRNIPLSSIAERTKIKASLFEALERDDVSRWPSGIFRRSFVRAYAEAIGLDADETLQDFLERFPDPQAPASAPAAAGHGAPRAPVLRLTLADTGSPFLGGNLLRQLRPRLAAAVWDAGSLVAIAVTAFIVLDAFWMPLGVAMLCYYLGGILVLGNTPGVCLFAPKSAHGDDDGHARPVPHDEPELNFSLSNEFQHL